MIKQCKVCNETFDTLKALKRHQALVHGVKKHMCQYCGKGFSNPSSAKHHEKAVHLNIKNISCDKCTFTCYSQSNLQTHIKR